MCIDFFRTNLGDLNPYNLRKQSAENASILNDYLNR